MLNGTAIFGHTGLVGGNLLRQTKASHLFNSQNSAEASGAHFDTVYFTAARAEKWKANADPTSDAEHVDRLVKLLGSFSTRRLILISTVDVFSDPRGVDEDTTPLVEGQQAYGRNRYRLELAAREIHPSALIVRLPGLFGPGLKKNIIFDLMTNNRLEFINPASRFQYYGLSNLANDIAIASESGLRLVHLTSEQIESGRLAREVFGVTLPPTSESVSVAYDFRTKYAESFGGTGHYQYSATDTLSAVREFVEGARS